MIIYYIISNLCYTFSSPQSWNCPATFHTPLIVPRAQKATGPICFWIRRSCSAIFSPLPGKIMTSPQTASRGSAIFSAKSLFPTSTIWCPISSTNWKNRIPVTRSVPEACCAPSISSCTGLKVSAVPTPTRRNRILPRSLPYRTAKKRARSPKTLW